MIGFPDGMTSDEFEDHKSSILKITHRMDPNVGRAVWTVLAVVRSLGRSEEHLYEDQWWEPAWLRERLIVAVGRQANRKVPVSTWTDDDDEPPI